jgi:lipid-A-disaccharide synthase
LRIGIVAGEVSGDFLAAGLIEAIKRRIPEAEFEGVAGPQMQAAGCRSLYPMERLSLMGFSILRELPGLVRMRRDLVRHFQQARPDLFIGVDAPDFNLGLEQQLKASGLRTVHYVSPSVWAWRRWRVKKIRRAADRILTLFPFEKSFYDAAGVSATFVGHPLADIIPEQPDVIALRARFGLAPDRRCIALLPGSRRSELEQHAALFVATARFLHQRQPFLQFIIPFANEALRAIFNQALQAGDGADLPIVQVAQQSREAMAASDVVLLASGTATLEAALLAKPMVVTYRVSLFSELVGRLLVRVKHVSLPNNLAGAELVPELIQRNATVEKLGAALERYLHDPAACATVVAGLKAIRHQLQCQANERAAEAVLAMLDDVRA